ncbi:DUF4214 domain-containing protein [Microvirga tunisiensis]|uniref:DUF4214 domain-containing protein n=1 Tax=Pannonibacter tanglangensis TaxID=2750084 RepID=A0A7X5J8M4_9HYPH|nr:DUF4214 domain-containing protein [Pannonibacter sp. XCT-53]NBN77626.1 DUF4214 domain-containing protein [Pannonibacter sp. XCT-53]
MSTMTTSALIKQYFNNILQREPKGSELSHWSMTIDSGILNAVQARDALAGSAEAMNYGAQIIRIYQAAFGRVPDTVGMKGWTTMLREDPTALFKIAGGFVNSLEWKTRYGDSSVSDTVLQALYVNVLGRSATVREIMDWKATGQSMSQILVGFSNSEEFTLNASRGVIKLLDAAGSVTSDKLSTVFDGKTKLTVVHGTKWPMQDHALSSDPVDADIGLVADTGAADDLRPESGAKVPASGSGEGDHQKPSLDHASAETVRPAADIATDTSGASVEPVDIESLILAAVEQDPTEPAAAASREVTVWHQSAEPVTLIGIADPA